MTDDWSIIRLKWRWKDMSLTDSEIKTLLEEKNETPNLDYKQEIIWEKSNREACLEIIKDILAMANTRNGGRIIFGVTDNDFEFMGVGEEAWKQFDVTPVNELLHRYADPIFTCSVIKRVIEDKKVVVIDVPEFNEVPILCKESAFAGQNNKEVLRKGALYVRTAKCSSEAISSVEDMRSILGRGLTKKSDELFQSIQKLITGKPLVPDKDANNHYQAEIKQAHEYLDKVVKEDLGYWKIISYPSTYESRLTTQAEAGQAIEEAKVLLRGWDFPHIDTHGNTTNFNKGKQSFLKWERHEEGWQLYQSGLLVWKKYFWEDIEGQRNQKENRPLLSFVGVIYSVTEYMLFFKRLYAEKLNVESIRVQIELGKCNNRQLASFESMAHIWEYISGEDKIMIEKDINVVELQASFQDVAKDIIKNIFMLFNWNDPADSMIEGWQKKLTERGGI